MLTVFGEGIRVPARVHLACSSPTSSLDALLVAIYTQDQKLVENGVLVAQWKRVRLRSGRLWVRNPSSTFPFLGGGGLPCHGRSAESEKRWA